MTTNTQQYKSDVFRQLQSSSRTPDSDQQRVEVTHFKCPEIYPNYFGSTVDGPQQLPNLNASNHPAVSSPSSDATRHSPPGQLSDDTHQKEQQNHTVPAATSDSLAKSTIYTFSFLHLSQLQETVNHELKRHLVEVPDVEDDNEDSSWMTSSSPFVPLSSPSLPFFHSPPSLPSNVLQHVQDCAHPAVNQPRQSTLTLPSPTPSSGTQTSAQSHTLNAPTAPTAPSDSAPRVSAPMSAQSEGLSSSLYPFAALSPAAQLQQYFQYYPSAFLIGSHITSYIESFRRRDERFRQFQKRQEEELRFYEEQKRKQIRQQENRMEKTADKTEAMRTSGESDLAVAFERAAQSLLDTFNKQPHVMINSASRHSKFRDRQSTPLWTLLEHLKPHLTAQDTFVFDSSRGNETPNIDSIHSEWLVVGEDNIPPESTTRHTEGTRTVNLCHEFRELSVSQFVLEEPNVLRFRRLLLPPEEFPHSTLCQWEVDLDELRTSALAYGIPNRFRAMIWQLLLTYLPAKEAEYTSRLARQRTLYMELVKAHCTQICPISDDSKQAEKNRILFNMIGVDVPRTHPTGFNELFSLPLLQHSLHRVLYIWSKTHPHISYFQGLNDLATPFYLVFLTAGLHFSVHNDDFAHNRTLIDMYLPHLLPYVEADVYGCLCILLDNLTQHNKVTMGGIYAEDMVLKLQRLLSHIDKSLCAHMTANGVEFIHFAFRWMLCLFIRELSIKNLICLWDAYIAEGDKGFAEFHIYVCAAYLKHFSVQLKRKNMTEMMMFLQHNEEYIAHWTQNDIHQLVLFAQKLFVSFPPSKFLKS